MDTFMVITIVSFIIFAGYLGDLAFLKFRFPDILILILIGYLIASFLKLNVNTILYTYLPLAATISLIIILFEGGVSLKVSMIRDVLKKSSLMALGYYIITFLMIIILLHLFSTMSISISVLYASILSAPSVAIVIPLINRSGIEEKRRHLYIVYVTILDLLSIVVTISFLNYFPISGAAFLPVIVSLLTNIFAQSFFGFLAGIFWIELLRKIERVELSYMLTLGFLFAIYAVSDILWSNGMITSIVFGIVLGNNSSFRRLLQLREYTIDENIFRFNREVVFFMRTAIFVAIGSVLTFSLNIEMITVIISIVMIIYISQAFISKIFEGKTFDRYTNYIMPRGLTQIVLGILTITSVASVGIVFIQYISYVVIITNIISAIIIYIKK
ncbi:MAG: cation:proton antiporter [Thermoplasmata archaeon]|jgi:NhaP-type Na+/H+ or K+/H+ antiporter|nr:hypothetical protein [Thermoplasmatales archaeon]PMP73945.1 MAG: hypothetical protein C0180_05385 [Aciduliprofundum sp.]